MTHIATNPPNVVDLIPQLDGGLVERKLNAATAAAALATLEYEKQSEVTIKLTLKRLGPGQIAMTHKLTSATPHSKGKATNEDATDTVLHVAPTGAMSYHPFEQMPIFPANLKAQS